MKRNIITIGIIKKYLLDNNSNTKLLSTKYNNNTEKLLLKCECGRLFYRDWAHIKRHSDCLCNECSYMKKAENKKTTLIDVGNILEEHYLTPLNLDYKNNTSKILCLTKDGYKVFVTIANICKGKFPIIFSFTYNYENLIFNINHYIEINNLDCEFIGFKDNLNNYHKSKLIMKCSCGEMFYPSLCSFIIEEKHQNRCKKCSKNKSTYEIYVSNWLKENKVEFIEQYRFNDCRVKNPLPFDFYIPSKNLCIEVDGQQHYYSTNGFFKDSYEKLAQYDKIKTNYCIKHNIKLIRIPFWKFYKNKKYEEILSINIL